MAFNPFKARHGQVGPTWLSIAANVTKALQGVEVSARTCQDRITKLLEHFRAENNEALRRSGTEEECQERDQLLQSIQDLKEESEV